MRDNGKMVLQWLISHVRLTYAQWTLLATSIDAFREHHVMLGYVTLAVALAAFFDPVGKPPLGQQPSWRPD